MAYTPMAYQTGRQNSLGSLVDSTIKKGILGEAPDLTAKFQEMDEATARGAAGYRNQAVNTLGQGGGRRNLQTAEQAIMSQVADNKLEQAKLLQGNTSNYLTAAMSKTNADNLNALAAAQFLANRADQTGDSATSAAATHMGMDLSGYDYTDAGYAQQAKDAATAAADAAKARAREDEQYRLALKAQKQSLARAGQSSWFSRMASGALKGGAAGLVTGNPAGAITGAGIGAVSNLVR